MAEVKAKVGRPPKLNEQERKEVYEALSNYINVNDDPTMAGFVSMDETAVKYELYVHNLKDWSEFSTLIKRMVQKQEAYLLTKAGNGGYNATVAIFRLKQPQHGYKDRFENDVTSNGETIGVQLSDSQYSQLVAARARRADT